MSDIDAQGASAAPCGRYQVPKKEEDVMIIKKRRDPVTELQRAIREQEKKQKRIERQLDKLQTMTVNRGCTLMQNVVRYQ